MSNKIKVYVMIDTETGKAVLIHSNDEEKDSNDEEKIWAKFAERNGVTVKILKDDWMQLYEISEYLVV